MFYIYRKPVNTITRLRILMRKYYVYIVFVLHEALKFLEMKSSAGHLNVVLSGTFLFTICQHAKYIFMTTCVTGQQGMLTPPLHLIPPLDFQRSVFVCCSPELYMHPGIQGITTLVSVIFILC